MEYLFATLPVLTLIAMLTLFKAPGWISALGGFGAAVLEALFVLRMPAGGIALASLEGVKSGLFPIGLVIIAALFVYAITVESGAIGEIKGMLSALSQDKRYLALIVVWGFGNFMEGMAGFGTAVAIPCAILVGIGFDPVKAVLCSLVANTTPTAFGSVGVPTMALAGESGFTAAALSPKIVLLQLAATSISPFLILFIADGFRGIREKFLLAIVADIAFLAPWFASALYLGCELPDIIGGISVMVVLGAMGEYRRIDARKAIWAWMPFAFVVAILAARAFASERYKISPGFLIIAAGFAGGIFQRIKIARIAAIFFETLKKYALAIATICLVLALAKTMGACGMTRALADGLVKLSGRFYCFVSTLVGSLGGFMTGSGTSSNVLFGALQASAGANDFERLVFCAANVMGAGIGKMISPQSIVLGCAAANLAGRESEIMKKIAPYFPFVLIIATISTILFAKPGS